MLSILFYVHLHVTGFNRWVRCRGREADLRGLSFRKATLQQLDFSDADLAGVDFREAVFDGSSLKDAHLKGARFEGADLRETDLSGVRLVDAALFKGAAISHQQAAVLVTEPGLRVM
ncbi:pentapeptide repeat-containing protein [Paraburkholderia sp. SIMBA_030]|uniref:pentapeptide repeat-containing protein n=1 Tax=Paraburkholderia sp. SIMBA_030 TaxID=3085773 RepID=UPI00397A5333